MADQYVVGVDYGTLSGRALVVRVSDGGELGSAVHAYRHAVVDRRRTGYEPPAAAGLGPAGARRTTSTCCGPPYPTRWRPRRVDPADVIGIATDFTACTMVPTHGRTARRCPSCREYADRAARLRQAVAAPRRPAAGRSDQRARRRAQARRGCPATAG